MCVCVGKLNLLSLINCKFASKVLRLSTVLIKLRHSLPQPGLEVWDGLGGAWQYSVDESEVLVDSSPNRKVATRVGRDIGSQKKEKKK